MKAKELMKRVKEKSRREEDSIKIVVVRKYDKDGFPISTKYYNIFDDEYVTKTMPEALRECVRLRIMPWSIDYSHYIKGISAFCSECHGVTIPLK